MIDKTHFQIPVSPTDELDDLAPDTQCCSTETGKPKVRLTDVEKRLALFEELLFDCAMTLKDKVAERLDHLEDLCHHETALLRQEFQQEDRERKKELNLLTLKISEAIDRIAAKKTRQSVPSDEQTPLPGNLPKEKGGRFYGLDGLPPINRPSKN